MAKSNIQKADLFAEYFKTVFRPYPSAVLRDDDREVLTTPVLPGLLPTPLKNFTKKEIQATINNLRPNKSPGFDLITGTVLKQLPKAGLQAITLLFNSILHTRHFPGQWKVSQIIPILKPGEPPEVVTSYRPISLLPVLSKLFEKLLVTRINPLLHAKQIIPDHQFGFRRKHVTTEQVHHVVIIIH